MREHLFRGQRDCSKEWITGNLFVGDNGICEIGVGVTEYRKWWEVDPKTVCRFTELTDKNGVRVFENDIIKITGLSCGKSIGLGIIKFGRYRNPLSSTSNVHVGFYILWIKLHSRDWEPCELGYFDDSIEVVGNIFDNPELLGGYKE